MARYAGEWATDTAASAVERAIGSATQRQDGDQPLQQRARVVDGRAAEQLRQRAQRQRQHVPQRDAAGRACCRSSRSRACRTAPRSACRRRRVRRGSRSPTTRRWLRGAHSIRFGGELQRIDAEFGLGVFQQGRIELVEDFPTFDHTGDGRIDDNDLLFAVTLRSGKPDQALKLPDSDNTHVAGFVQDDWSVSNRLQLNVGLRYEIDTEVNNQSRVDELNPIVLPFVTGERQRDLNNLSPRVGFAWNADDRGDCSCAAATASTTTASSCRSSRSSAGSTAARCRSRSAPATSSSSIPTTGRLPPFAPTLVESVHRIHPARCRRIGHQHHRPAPAEPDWCTSSISGSRRRVAGRERARRRHAQPGPALPDRPHGRRSVQSGRRRARSRREHRIERADASTTRCCVSLDRQLAGRSQLPARLHAGEGVQLRQRRSDPVPQRADRSERPARASSDRRPTTGAIGSWRRVSATLPGAVSLAALWTMSSACRWTS